MVTNSSFSVHSIYLIIEYIHTNTNLAYFLKMLHKEGLARDIH